jgi:hypothetical protein
MSALCQHATRKRGSPSGNDSRFLGRFPLLGPALAVRLPPSKRRWLLRDAKGFAVCLIPIRQWHGKIAVKSVDTIFDFLDTWSGVWDLMPTLLNELPVCFGYPRF